MISRKFVKASLLPVSPDYLILEDKKLKGSAKKWQSKKLHKKTTVFL